MLSYNEAAAIAAAPTNASIEPSLRTLLANRVADWAAADVLDLTYLMIIEPGDTERTLLDTAGYTPLFNPLSGKRFREKGYSPSFDLLHLTGRYYELFETVSNDGFAFVVYIPDSLQVDPELLALCRAHIWLRRVWAPFPIFLPFVGNRPERTSQ